MTRWRVMPLRKVPFGIGVNTTPSLPMNTLELASSATLPSMSQTRQLSKPRDVRLEHGARVVRIEAAGLGIDRRAFDGRPLERRQRDREAVGLAHRRVVERQRKARRIPGRGGSAIGPARSAQYIGRT